MKLKKFLTFLTSISLSKASVTTPNVHYRKFYTNTFYDFSNILSSEPIEKPMHNYEWHKLCFFAIYTVTKINITISHKFVSLGGEKHIRASFSSNVTVPYSRVK